MTSKRSGTLRVLEYRLVTIAAIGSIALALAPAARARGFETTAADGAALAVPLAAGVQTQLLVPSPDRATIELAEASSDDDVLRRLELELGKSVYVNTGYAVKRVSVGNPDILDIVVMSPRELQLVPKALGGTNVLLWSAAGRPAAAIDVQVGNQNRHIENELRRIFDSEDITVEGTPSGVILRGSVWSALAMEQAVEVTRSYLGFDRQADRQSRGGRSRGGVDRVVNLLRVEGNQQVMLEVIIAEMSRSVRRELGMDFNALIESGGDVFNIFSLIQGTPSAATPTGFETISSLANLAGFFDFGSTQLLVLMDLLETNGLSRTLARPNLIARSGQSASFLVGGDVPIPVAQSGSAVGAITVEFREFGVGLNFLPTVLGPDRIHIEVSSEVSVPDESLGTSVQGTNVPAFNTRRASTGVELSDGQSFAIAGLLREELVEVSAQWPVLGNIPVFGALFRSSEFEKRNTEVVIIITPHLAKPLEPGPPELPTDHFIEPEAWEFFLYGALESSRLPPGHRAARTAATPGGIIGDVGPQVSVSQLEATP